MGFWFLGGGERNLGGAGWGWAWGGGVEPGEKVAEQWGPLAQRALSSMWVGPPEVSH